MIVVLMDVGGAPDVRARLRAQLAALPDRARVRMVETGPSLDGLVPVAARADENGEGVALVPDDLVVADRRLGDLLDDPRPRTRLLVTEGRVPAGPLVVRAADTARAAAAWSAPAPEGGPLQAAVHALVAAGVGVTAVAAEPFVAGRDIPVATAAAVDEDDLVWRHASRGGDGVWSTFALRPVSRRVTRRAVRAGRTPNQITVAGLVLGLVAAVLVALGAPATVVVGALLLQVALLLDCVDGEIARTTRSYTTTGAWLDLVTDRVKEGALLAAIAVADPSLWPLALAGLLVQLTRHMADYAFADSVLAHWRQPGPDVPELPAAARRGLSHWVRQAIHMQIGERWLVLTLGLLVGVAVDAPAAPLVGYLVLVGFGLLWVLVGWTLRTVRSPHHRESLPAAVGTLVGALRDDGVLGRHAAKSPASWLLAPLVTALEGGALLAGPLATDRSTLPWAFGWGAVVAWHRYDIAYRTRAGRPPAPRWVDVAAGGWALRAAVVAVGAATGVLDVLLPVGATWLLLVVVPESLLPKGIPLRPAVLRKSMRRALAVPVTRLLMCLIDPRRIALVAGLPDSEENSLATAVGLAGRYAGDVVLVAADPAAARAALDRAGRLLQQPVDRVRVVPKRGLATYRLFVRAELVFYTHGLYDSPRPVGRRLHVNLWHGTGPKWNANANFAQRIGAQAHAASSPTWGLAAIDALSLGAGTRIVIGNPRQDVVAAAHPDVARLGLDPTRPLVLWLPTFRSSLTAGVVGLREGEPIAADTVTAFADAAARHGVQLVAKPHRLDSETFRGVTVVTDEQLRAADVTLYELLGHAAGVVSDYSSVWVDVLDRPVSIGLHVPDIDTYRRARGLNRPDLAVAAAGLELTVDTVDGFFADVTAGRVWRADARHRCVERIEYRDVPPGRRTACLFDELAQLARERFGQDLGLAQTSS